MRARVRARVRVEGQGQGQGQGSCLGSGFELRVRVRVRVRVRARVRQSLLHSEDTLGYLGFFPTFTFIGKISTTLGIEPMTISLEATVHPN